MSLTSDKQLSGNEESTWSPQKWQAEPDLGAVKKLAEQKDPSAIAILNLYKQFKQESDNRRQELQNESKNFERRLEEYERSLGKTDKLIIGSLIFIAVSFLTTISLVFFDLIKEKDLYLQNNNLYQNYSETNSQLKDIIYERKIEVNNLKNELEIWGK